MSERGSYPSKQQTRREATIQNDHLLIRYKLATTLPRAEFINGFITSVDIYHNIEKMK